MAAARRVALVAGAGSYVGPPLARLLAERGHDLVLGDPSSDQVAELQALLAQPGAAQALVDAAMARFGHLDSATSFSGAIVTGRFMRSTVDDLRTVIEGCMVAPYQFLQAVLPPMIAAGEGQVLVITSASAARATPGAPLYSAARAGATHLVHNVADEVARHHVQVNSVGTNFMDFPEFRRANGADDPAVRAKLEAMVPLGRLGTMDEFAHFCMPYVDGTSRFTTGQFTAYAGGWA
jgi:NAD(P)-dependent dehydrogenase (short-subunit alcohol dehydrogenase family)